MRKPPRDRYALQWHERVQRPGPGRKQLLIGEEAFLPVDLDRLMVRAHGLAADGYLISITPPTAQEAA